MQITQEVRVDLQHPWRAQEVHAKQGDAYSRRIRFDIFNGAAAWTVPGGTVAEFHAYKPDGTFCDADAIISGNAVYVTLDEQVTAVPGQVRAEVTLTNGGYILSTFLVYIIVQAAAVPDDAIESQVEITAYREIVEQISEIVGDAEDIADQAEAIKDQVELIAEQVHVMQGAPLVAATVAEMTDTDRVYVYTGSEAGYTAGSWYYYDGAAWTLGGVYNSVAVQTDDTLSIVGQAADAKAAGDRISDADNRIKHLFKSSALDYSNVTTETFNIATNQKWTASVNYKSYTFAISEDISEITVTAGPDGGIIAFLNSYTPVAGQLVDYATAYPARIVLSGGETRTYVVSGNMNYMFTLLKNQNGDRTPTTYLHVPNTDPTLTKENIPADAKATGDVKDVASAAFTMAAGYCTTIPDNTDYDTIKTRGNYLVASTANAQTMTNCPTTQSHRLFVMYLTGSTTPMQLVVSNAAPSKFFYRRLRSGVWSDWERFAIYSELEPLIESVTKTAPDYVKAEADRVAEKVRNVQTGTSISFVAVSDMHFNVDDADDNQALYEMGEAVKEIANQIHVDFYASFGDILYRLSSSGDFDKGKQEAVSMTKILNNCFGNSPQVRVLGNHDPNAEGETGYFTANQVNTFSGIYNNGYTKDPLYPYGAYCYRDDEDRKVRFIVLNTSFYEQENQPTQGSTQYSVGLTQAYWLCQALDLSEKDDASSWQIVILSHVPMDTDHGDHQDITNRTDVFNAYVNGQTWSAGEFSYDFSGKNAAKIALYLCGHHHSYQTMNLNYMASGSVINALYIPKLYVPNALNGRELESMDGVTYTKTPGTGESTAFQVITVDFENKVAYAHHYGAGIDVVLHYEPSTETSLTTDLTAPSWDSKNTNIATVSNGTVTPVASGHVVIWCKSTTDNCIEAWNFDSVV